MYLVGGWDGYESTLDVDQLDFRTRKWQRVLPQQEWRDWLTVVLQTGCLSSPRDHGVGVCAYGGYMWAIGGIESAKKSTSTVERSLYVHISMLH